MRSANPALKTDTFADFRQALGAEVQEEKQRMTLQGTVNRTGALVILCLPAPRSPGLSPRGLRHHASQAPWGAWRGCHVPRAATAGNLR